MKRVASSLLLVVSCAVACSLRWEPPLAHQQPTSEDWLAGSFVHVVTSQGLARLAERSWRALAPRYADGREVALDVSQAGEPGEAAVVYGPGAALFVPIGLRFEIGEAGSVAVGLDLGSVAASLDVRVPMGEGQALACRGALRFGGARYEFAVSPERDSERSAGVALPGVFRYELAFVELSGCDFPFDASHEQQLLSHVRGGLAAALEAEWREVLAASAEGALAPRFVAGASVSTAPVPVQGEAVASSHLALALEVSQAQVAHERGLAYHYDGGVAAGLSPWDGRAFTPVEHDAVLNTAPAPRGPSGQPWDEAVVVGRALLHRAALAAEHAGLVAGALAVEGEALRALWPAHGSLFLRRIAGDRFWLRVLARDEAGEGLSLQVLRPPPDAEAQSALRVEIESLAVEVYGQLGEIDLLLTRVLLSGVSLELLPYADEAGWLRLRIVDLAAREVGVEDGAVTVAEPSIELLAALIEAAAPGPPLASLGGMGGASRVVLESAWLDDESYVLYLRTE